jgi:hypothetical protein
MKEIVLNLLGSELLTEVGNYLQLLLSSRPRYHPSLAIIANTHWSLVLISVFTQEVASDSTQIIVAFV